MDAALSSEDEKQQLISKEQERLAFEDKERFLSEENKRLRINEKQWVITDQTKVMASVHCGKLVANVYSDNVPNHNEFGQSRKVLVLREAAAILPHGNRWKTRLIYNGSCLCLSLMLAGSMLCIGLIYVDDCPKQKYIPIFLIVGGILTIISSSAVFLNRIMQIDDNFPMHRYAIGLTNILNGITFSWYIAGCILVYGAYKPIFNMTSAAHETQFCHRNLYLFSFWLFNSFFIVSGAFLIVLILLFIFGIMSNSCNN